MCVRVCLCVRVCVCVCVCVFLPNCLSERIFVFSKQNCVYFFLCTAGLRHPPSPSTHTLSFCLSVCLYLPLSLSLSHAHTPHTCAHNTNANTIIVTNIITLGYCTRQLCVLPVAAVNVAPGKTYRHSETTNGYSIPANNAANGNTGGTYDSTNCIHMRSYHKVWWEVDLGRVYSLYNFKVWARFERE